MFIMKFKSLKFYFMLLMVMMWSLFSVYLLVDGYATVKNSRELKDKTSYKVEDYDKVNDIIIANNTAISKLNGVKQVKASVLDYYISSDRVLYTPMDIVLMTLRMLPWITASVVLILACFLFKFKWWVSLIVCESCLCLFNVLYYCYMGAVNLKGLMLMLVVCLAFIFFTLRKDLAVRK